MTAIEEAKRPLLEQFHTTRDRTLDLVKTIERDDYMVQTAVYASPPKWHLGHVSWIYETIMSKIDDTYEFYSKEFSAYLNSYYQQFGEPKNKGMRGAVSRPTLEQVLGYFDVINQRVGEFIASHRLDAEQARLITTGFHHECQHQELLAYDLQHLLAEQYMPVKRAEPPRAASVRQESIPIESSMYDMGYEGKEFCYDVELPVHRIYLEKYEIDSLPVTNKEYMKFVEDGGYHNYRYWLADGWDKLRENEWECPMYWEKIDGTWHTADFAGRRRINPDEPVCHVSYYEASAYCKWANKRLPSEGEWEKAALWNDKKRKKMIFPWGDGAPTNKTANLLESHLWKCSEVGSYPDGKSPAGCHQMIGDVWEWTSSEFVGYPGFVSGFEEYNDKWFTNQKVLRGGSFGTPAMSIRGSYRNFFRLDERWMFCGFRCAQDG